MDSKIKWMIAGVIVLLILKYVVFGLAAWDAALHPTRKEDPASPFLKPFLGAFSS